MPGEGRNMEMRVRKTMTFSIKLDSFLASVMFTVIVAKWLPDTALVLHNGDNIKVEEQKKKVGKNISLNRNR